MTLKEALFELINENILIDFDEQNNSIEITESHDDNESYKKNTSKKEVLRSVKIVGIEEFIIAFKPDEKNYQFLGGLIKDKIKHIKKACDGIIFCEIKEQNYIFSIELKSNENSGIYQKFKNSQIFIGLVNGIMKIYFDVEHDFEAINILFDRKTTDKTIAKKWLKDITYFHQGLKLQDSLVHIHPFISQQNK